MKLSTPQQSVVDALKKGATLIHRGFAANAFLTCEGETSKKVPYVTLVTLKKKGVLQREGVDRYVLIDLWKKDGAAEFSTLHERLQKAFEDGNSKRFHIALDELRTIRP